MTLFYALITLMIIKLSNYIFFKSDKLEKNKLIINILISIIILIVLLSHPSKILIGIWLVNNYFQIGIVIIFIVFLLFIKNKYLYSNKSLSLNIKLIAIEVFIILLSAFIWSMTHTLISACWLCLPENTILNSSN